VTDTTARPSYRALLGVPSLGRILLSATISRIAGGMLAVALVLFTLDRYDSPALAGLVTFVGIMPGLLVSPIAGALLDRHGRTRLIILDFLVASFSLVLIGVLALADQLPAPLLILIAAAASLTQPLSNTGLRSIFPLIVPPYLWERANAVDSNGYVVATLIGPPLAGVLVQVWGGPQAIITIGLIFLVAAVIMVGVPDPENETVSTGKLLVDAWQGLLYAWNNRTIRGLGFSISILNLAGGMIVIVLPILVIDHLGGSEILVGLAFAVSGLSGMAAAFFFGRWDSRGLERRMLAWPMLGYGAAVALFIPAVNAAPVAGIALILAAMTIMGFLNGPLDIALFTLRQRRTDPAWVGRAFAVSMALNFVGFPIGSAAAGAIVDRSIVAAIALGVVASLVGAAIAWFYIPQDAPTFDGALEAAPE
jgi:MFS family permease